MVDDVEDSWRVLGGVSCFGFGSREAQVEALLVSLSNDRVSFPAKSSVAESFGCRVSSWFAVWGGDCLRLLSSVVGVGWLGPGDPLAGGLLSPCKLDSCLLSENATG